MSFSDVALTAAPRAIGSRGRQQLTCKCLLKDVPTNIVRSLLCLDVCLPARGVVAFQDRVRILT